MCFVLSQRGRRDASPVVRQVEVAAGEGGEEVDKADEEKEAEGGSARGEQMNSEERDEQSDGVASAPTTSSNTISQHSRPRTQLAQQANSMQMQSVVPISPSQMQSTVGSGMGSFGHVGGSASRLQGQSAGTFKSLGPGGAAVPYHGSTCGSPAYGARSGLGNNAVPLHQGASWHSQGSSSGLNSMPVQATAWALSQGSMQSWSLPSSASAMPVSQGAPWRSQAVNSMPMTGAMTSSFQTRQGSSNGLFQQQSNVKTSIQGGHAGAYHSCQARIELWRQLEIKAQMVKRGELLGRGSYAEVYKGRARGSECAIKVFRNTATQRHRDDAIHEMKLSSESVLFHVGAGDPYTFFLDQSLTTSLSQLAGSLDHPCTLRFLGWIRNPLQTITELCQGDLIMFYKNKIEGMEYREREALRLLRVGLLETVWR